MKKMTFDKIKQESPIVHIAIHDFCLNNNLRYFLACGTLLGAIIRHKGFIPWDDDTDLLC